MAERATEVWVNRWGNGQIDVAPSASVAGPMITGDTAATMRFCNVQVVDEGRTRGAPQLHGPERRILGQLDTDSQQLRGRRCLASTPISSTVRGMHGVKLVNNFNGILQVDGNAGYTRGVTQATIRTWLVDWRTGQSNDGPFAWIDRSRSVVEASGNFGPALRLFGVQRFRSGQLSIVLAALSGKSVVVNPAGPTA